MKKGCFLKFIIIFTIILAATLYIVQNKFEKIFLNPGKELLITSLEEAWEDNLNYLKESVAKDSLKSLLKSHIKKLKSTQDLSSDRIEETIKYLESTFKDSLVDLNELTDIRELLEKELLNEK